MTWPAAASNGAADPRNSRADRWISRTAAATVAALAGLAGAMPARPTTVAAAMRLTRLSPGLTCAAALLSIGE